MADTNDSDKVFVYLCNCDDEKALHLHGDPDIPWGVKCGWIETEVD